MTAGQRRRAGASGSGHRRAEGRRLHHPRQPGRRRHRGSAHHHLRRSVDRGQGAQSHCPRCGHGRTRSRETSFRPMRSPRAPKSPRAQTFSRRTSRWKSSSWPDAKEIGGVAADAIAALLDAQTRRGAGPGHRIVAAGDLRRTGCALRRRAGLVSAGPRLHPRRVRRPARRPSRAVPDRHRRRCSCRGSTSRRARSQGPDGLAADIPAACAAYENAIRDAGGVDLQILGIGTDGHIGFNEPGSSLASRTRIKTLTRQTRIDNARFFGDDVESVPTHCLTQGLATIMEARHVILVATGRSKAEAVHHLVEGAGQRAVARDHPAASSARDGAARRRRGPPASAGRLLPRDLPLEAGLAGHLSAAGHRRHPAHGPRTVAARMD